MAPLVQKQYYGQITCVTKKTGCWYRIQSGFYTQNMNNNENNKKNEGTKNKNHILIYSKCKDLTIISQTYEAGQMHKSTKTK